MAIFLYRVGRASFRRRRLVAVVWLALLVALGFAAATAGSSSGGSLTVPGTESQRAFDLVKDRFPGSSADGATARVVFKADAGHRVTSAANRATIESAVTSITSSSEQIASVADPFTTGTVNKAGTVAYIQVTYKTTPTELTDDTVNALKKVGDSARGPGLAVEIGGDALTTPPGVGGTELIGVLIAAATLLVTFGGLVAAGMPLLTALIGVGIGVAGIAALSSPLNLSSTTPILALMIGLAVGIDYALFIVSRYRNELADGHEREEAVGRALGTAGSAVAFAGLTVVIALAGLSVVNIPTLTAMGLAAAGTVVVAVLVALTLIPALLGFAGPRVFGRKKRKDPAAARGTSRGRAGTRWATFVLAHPVAVLVTGVIGLGVIAIPLGSLSMALPDDGHLPPNTTQRRAYDLLTEGFGAGFNGPLLVAVDGSHARDPKGAVAASASAISALPGVDTVDPATFDTAGDTATLTVVPKTGPNDPATKGLVKEIRRAGGRVRTDTGGEMLVSGRPALNIDISSRLSDALVPYLAVVVGLAFLLLMLVFRSILIPLKAALGFLLSVLSALGSMVAVFQWGWLSDITGVDQTGPVVSTMPIFLIGVVFGLAMDYEVFLVSRMREAHAHGASPREAVVAGFTHGARVVTAGAIIMISVFLGFVGSTGSEIKMLGFGLGIAVLFDAFVVRMAIVPAVLALIGTSAWWLPGWLDRLLPHVDIEGDNIPRPLAAKGSNEVDRPATAIIRLLLYSRPLARSSGRISWRLPGGSGSAGS
jgi:RND superfamily putative drug exporter